MSYSYPDREKPTPPVLEPREHRCGICYGPYGKSALRCKNEPGDGLDRARDFLAKRAEFMKEANG